MVTVWSPREKLRKDFGSYGNRLIFMVWIEEVYDDILEDDKKLQLSVQKIIYKHKW